MATPVIKLEPICMGSLIGKAPATSPAPASQKYVRPGIRVENAPVALDFGATNFPSLGATPKMVASWQKSCVKIPSLPNVEEQTTSLSLKDVVKEQIRQAEIEEERKKKAKEEDPEKMSDEERLADGWASLPLSRQSVNDCKIRLNTPIAFPAYEDYCE